MIEWIESIDEKVVLAINGFNNPAADKLMMLFSEKFFWMPVYLLLAYALYRKYPGKTFIFVLLSAALCILLCDRISVEVFKEEIGRYRPTHNLLIKDKIHFVTDWNGNPYRGGLYGFFSSHAANYASITTLFLVLMGPVRRWLIALLAVWVLLICYSRMYVAAHYPSDIIAGILFGMVTGWIVAQLFFYLTKKMRLPG